MFLIVHPTTSADLKLLDSEGMGFAVPGDSSVSNTYIGFTTHEAQGVVKDSILEPNHAVLREIEKLFEVFWILTLIRKLPHP